MEMDRIFIIKILTLIIILILCITLIFNNTTIQNNKTSTQQNTSTNSSIQSQTTTSDQIITIGQMFYPQLLKFYNFYSNATNQTNYVTIGTGTTYSNIIIWENNTLIGEYYHKTEFDISYHRNMIAKVINVKISIINYSDSRNNESLYFKYYN